jgi:hypothetical protein
MLEWQRMDKNFWKKYFPVIIAATLALIVAIYYLSSGKNNLNNNIHGLESSPVVDKVETSGDDSIVIHCKNGDTYGIVYKQGQTDYQDLVFNKCGPSGEISATQQN